MSNKLRISVVGLIGAVGGFGLQGCFAPQPTPECNVTITSAGLGLGPYYVVLKKVDGTGTCSTLTHMYAGMQRFRTQPNGGDFTLAVRNSLVVDPYLGKTFTADVDPSNNCANEKDCQGKALADGGEELSGSCVILQADGGLEVYDGTPVILDMDGGLATAEPTDGGAPFEVDPANECASVEDPISRFDPTDPNGKKLNAIGKMPQFPSNNVCSITEWTGGEQKFQQEILKLVDGTTTAILPAIVYKTEFTNFNVVNSTKVPGTAFVSDLKYTEGGCVANYKAIGFWPEVHCTANANCDPNADLDAGRFFGSGINPEFKSTCDLALKVCVPTVDVTTIK